MYNSYYGGYASNYGSYGAGVADASIYAMLGTALGAFFTFFLILILAIIVIQIVANWKLFTKAGEKGWKSIIPIYNLVTLFKISGLSPWIICAYLLCFIPFVGWLITLGITIYLSINLSKSFGKSTGFTVGLILVPSIFYLMLAFGKSEYVGPGGNANTETVSDVIDNTDSNQNK